MDTMTNEQKRQAVCDMIDELKRSDDANLEQKIDEIHGFLVENFPPARVIACNTKDKMLRHFSHTTRKFALGMAGEKHVEYPLELVKNGSVDDDLVLNVTLLVAFRYLACVRNCHPRLALTKAFSDFNRTTGSLVINF